jgi:hypothetical protein
MHTAPAPYTVFCLLLPRPAPRHSPCAQLSTTLWGKRNIHGIFQPKMPGKAHGYCAMPLRVCRWRQHGNKRTVLYTWRP